MNLLGPVTTSAVSNSTTSLSTPSISSSDLGKDYDMLVFVVWGNALTVPISSVTWNGEALNYGASADGVNGGMDIWYSDGTAQSSGVVTVDYGGSTAVNVQIFVMLFGDVRRGGSGWLDDFFDMNAGSTGTATITASATYAKFKSSTVVFAAFFEATSTSANADQGNTWYSNIQGSGVTSTELVVGTTSLAYQTGATLTVSLTAGTSVWTIFGIAPVCRQVTRGVLKAGDIVYPVNQTTL